MSHVFVCLFCLSTFACCCEPSWKQLDSSNFRPNTTEVKPMNLCLCLLHCLVHEWSICCMLQCMLSVTLTVLWFSFSYWFRCIGFTCEDTTQCLNVACCLSLPQKNFTFHVCWLSQRWIFCIQCKIYDRGMKQVDTNITLTHSWHNIWTWSVEQVFSEMMCKCMFGGM